MKLAIASKAYQSFTRPLPMAVLKTVALEKNQLDLPKMDDGAGKDRVVKIDSILPKEFRTINPNLHIYSEEIAKALDETHTKLEPVAAPAKSQPRNIQQPPPLHKEAKNGIIIEAPSMMN